jgi:Tfp pilus assembly protein PilF
MALLGKWFGFGREEIFDQGIRAFDHGDWEGAIERFEACVEGANDPAMVRLARFYLSESYAQLGTAAFRAADYPNSVANLMAAIEISPSYPDLHIALARAFSRIGDQARRGLAIDRALEINPKYIDGQFEHGLYLYENGHRDQGLAEMSHAVECDSALSRESFRIGLEQDAAGNYEKAASAFSGAGAEDADAGDIHLRLAANYQRERMFSEAAMEYELAVQLLPAYPDLYFRFGQVLLELDREAEAIACFREATRLNPRYVQAHVHLGIALIRTRQNDLAKTEFQRALELDPQNPVALKEVQHLA